MIKSGTIVKFQGNQEPCIVYHVIDSTPIMQESEALHKICEHVRIEVMGLIPLELLEEAYEHPGNRTAFDLKLRQTGQLN